MTSSVVLSAAMRTNLLTLQRTQSDIDVVQNRLATGLKVNSALDNPQNFFTAQALNNRASDLSRLLDGIGQSIRTIEEADKGVSALTDLVQQADSIVQTARDELAASEGEARATGDVDLSNLTGGITSLGGIDDADIFTIQTVDDAGLAITETITIASGDTAESLAAKISNAFADNQDNEVQASVNDSGYLEIFSKDGRSFLIQDSTATGTELGLAGFQALGLGNYFADVDDGLTSTTNVVASATIVSGDTLNSRSIYEDDGDLIEAGDTVIGTYEDVDGNTLISGLAAADTIEFTVSHGGTTSDVTVTLAATTTFQDVIDAINSDTTVNPYIEASFDANNGQIQIQSINVDTDSVTTSVTAAGAGANFNLGFGSDSYNFATPAAFEAGGLQERVYGFSTGISELASLADDYNEIRNQIDRIVVDANYRGINLLQGDDLTTFFNENRTSSLTTEGTDFSSSGLGLTEIAFDSAVDIDRAADEVATALSSVRDFGSTLANDLSIIQTRQTFTEETINTLEAGADDLTVADLNEEGANLLALQTRQQLGTTSLSLASQSQQSVLRLF